MSTISLLLLSSTHNTWPYTPDQPAPNVDVFIHCGDLTQYGGLPSFRRAIDNIKSIDAELKLVIVGNHDVDLDAAWVAKFAEDEDDIAVSAQCVYLMRSQEEFEVYYLDEGTREFTLKDGRSFSVYATPYTREFWDFAFLYTPDEDRFNSGQNTIPGGVDIVTSHGPPAFPMFTGYKLDVSKRGEHAGCEKLGKALERTRPTLACFGHIHEGRGAASVS